MGRAARALVPLVLVLAGLILARPAEAETIIKKSTTYFYISGKTPSDLDRELMKRGPLARSTGMRHPGVTRIRFGGTVTYVENARNCRIGAVKVQLTTQIILPRWKNRRRASPEMALIWDTLAADIKRHEERHAEIARNHARSLEKALQSLGTASNCYTLKDKVALLSAKAVEQHSEDQQRFDRVEAINFNKRMMRLLQYRQSARN